MDNNYDSFLEIAVSLMKKKKKPQSLDSMTKEVFSKKGVVGTELQIAQFQVDFMLSGFFVCCGEDKSGHQLWDLKTRQNSSLLDKDGGYLKDLNDDDDEVKKNELKEDDFENHEGVDQYIEDDEEEDKSEPDEIEEEMGLVNGDSTSDEDESIVAYDDDDDEDDVEEEDEDDIEAELNK